jgi:hypothetical protein
MALCVMIDHHGGMKPSFPTPLSPSDARTTAANRAMAGLAFALYVAVGLLLVFTKRYPSAFDELEHVAYAVFLQETHEWRPMFESMRDLPWDSLTRWDTRPNYLGHPSPFYWYETLFLDRTLPLGQAVVWLRLGSAGLVGVGVALALRAGAGAFARDRLGLAVFCALVALCPKLLAVTGQVTNDALACLAGGVAYWAALSTRRGAGQVGMGLAMVLALWAKPNAGLAVGAALGLYALMRWRARPWLIPVLAAGAVLGAVPTAFIVAKYGALVPMTVEQFGGVHQIPGIAAYLPAFLFNLAYTFCFDQTGAWPIPGPGAVLAVALVWGLLAAVALGGALAWRARHAEGQAGEPAGVARVVATVAPLAFLAVLPIHFWFSATRLGGSLPAASFRYYLPIWPFLAHAVGSAVALTGAPLRRIVAALAFTTLAVTWLSP